MSETVLLPCEWRPVPGFEGIYEVSDDGRVRCWVAGGGQRRRMPREKKAQHSPDGYLFVVLYRDRKRKGFMVSRLVLLAFVGTPSEKMEASHTSGNKLDNRLQNLRWESRQANEDRKRDHGTRPAKLTEEDVIKIRSLKPLGIKRREIASAYSISMGSVTAIWSRKKWRHVA